MGEIIVKIWFIMAVLPFILFIEGNKKFSAYLKRKNIYRDWDMWHSTTVFLILLVIILWLSGV